MAAPAYVQHTTDISGGTSQTVLTLSGVVSGHAVIVLLSQYNSADRTYAITDSAGNTYTEGIWRIRPGSVRCGIFWADDVVGGDLTITVQGTGSSSMRALAIEVTALDGVATLDAADSYSDAAASFTHYCAQAGNIDTGTDVFLVAVAALTSSSSPRTAGDGFTELTTATAACFFAYRESDAALTDVRGEWTTGFERVGAHAIAAFKGASSGGTTYNESITLSAASALTGASQAVFQATMTLAAGAGLSDASQAALSNALTFGAAGAVTATSQATLGNAITLGASAALTAQAQAVLQAALTFSAAAGLTASSQLVAQAALSLSAIAALSAVGNVEGAPQTYDESLTFSAAATVTAQSQAIVQAVTTYAAAAGLSASSQHTIGEALALDILADLATAAQRTTAASVTLGASANLSAQSQAQLHAAISLAVAAVLTAAGAVAGAPSYTVLRVAAERLRAAAAATEALTAAQATSETLRAAAPTDEDLT